MNASLALVLSGTVGFAASSTANLLLPIRLRLAERTAAALAVVAAALGVVGALLALLGHGGAARADWSLPGLSFAIATDPLSGLFLLPIFVIPAAATVYGIGYHRAEPARARHVRACLGGLVAGMALLVLARNGALFLVGWETMAISAFLAIATEHDKARTRDAAWLYLATTHFCTLCLVAMVALLATPDGSLDWSTAAAPTLSSGRATVVFALALVGFGLKAGLMPLHVWLPAAHGNAPSHVSAVLSGVLIKMGAYGFLRVWSLLPPLAPGCGYVVLAVGAATMLLAVAATLAQTDLKRLLAYSSIENIGIVFVGIGLAMVGQARGETTLFVLGLGGALFHVLNHGLCKSLLFLGAGVVVHATGTRQLDRLGGLWRRLGATGPCFATGAAAISGLPPLAGFAGEFALYLGLFAAATNGDTGLAVAGTAALATLAMVGGLSVATFVRATAATFLGRARTAASAAAHAPEPVLTRPLVGLAAVCVLVGLGPSLVAPLIDGAIGAIAATRPLPAATPPLATLVPFGWITAVGVPLLLAIGLGWRWLANVRARTPAPAALPTWDCGYVDATGERVQYTGTAMGQLGVRMLGWTVRLRRRVRVGRQLFGTGGVFVQRPGEPLLRGALWPWATRLADWCQRLRFLQRGNLHIYLVYVLVVLVVLLAVAAAEG